MPHITPKVYMLEATSILTQGEMANVQVSINHKIHLRIMALHMQSLKQTKNHF